MELALTIEIGASQSIIKPDFVKGKQELLSNVSLLSGTGEIIPIYGKIIFTIANMNVDHVFIIGNIVDDFLIINRLKLYGAASDYLTKIWIRTLQLEIWLQSNSRNWSYV